MPSKSSAVRKLLLVLGVVACCLAVSHAAMAAPISVISGNYFAPSTPGASLLLYSAGFVFEPLSPDPIFLATMDPLRIDFSSYSGSPGPVTLINPTSGLSTIVLHASGGGSAVFTLTNPGIWTIGPAHDLLAEAVLTSNTTASDLGLVGVKWNFELSAQGGDIAVTPGVPGTVSIIRPGAVSFTLVMIPEPTTLALSTVGLGLVGVYAVRRRRSNKS